MIYRKFGKTFCNISAIGFGGMRFEDDPEKSAKLIKRAYELGINYFDTAPKYGKSEDFFGIALQDMFKTKTQKPFYISTKTFGMDSESVRKDIENSLTRMGIPYIDFYHVWCIMSMENFREREKKGVLKEFEKLKSEGLVKHICVSTHMNGDEITELLSAYPFDGILLGYFAMNFAYREKGLDAAKEKNIGVIVMNPLGGGLIPQNPEMFSFLKTRNDESVVQAALRFLINDNRINVSLVGFSNEEQLLEAVSAVDGFKPIPENKICEIRNEIKKSFNEICTGCRYCDLCPLGIPVPRFMDAYNMLLLYKKDDAIQNRLKWHWGYTAEKALEILSKCCECGICKRKCTQKLPILKRFSHIRELLQKSLQESNETKTDSSHR